MAGICGWLDSRLDHTRAHSVLGAMTTRLDQHTAQRQQIHRGNAALAASSPFGDISVYQADGVVVTLRGRIHSENPAIAAAIAQYNPAAGVLAAWQRDGRAGLTQIHGSFALALCDPDNHTALLAVDRAGAQPLCYAQTPGGLAFASRADALGAHPDVSQRINQQAIFDYLYFHFVPAPTSIFDGVKKLLPAQFVEFRNGQLETGFYWHLHYDDHASASQGDLAARFRPILRDAVARAAQGEHLGTFLSGGLDSSTVTGTLAQLSPTPVNSYSIGFEADGFDEMEYARLAAKTFATHPHEYYLKPADIVTAIPIIASAYDEPFANESAVPTYFCAKLAHDDGTRILLGGDGGDEIFGGNARYAKQKIFEAYGHMPGWLRSGVIEPLAHLPGMAALPPGRKLQSYLHQAKVPLPDRMESYNFLHRTPLAEIFNPDFLAQIQPDQPGELLREVYQRSDSAHFINRMMHLDLKFTLADNDLRKVGHMTEAAGIEVRYPLLDDALLDFSGQVPVHLKVKGTRLRHFFKEAVRDLLPPEIINKSKHGFGLPFGVWATTHAPLRDMVQDSLAAFERRQILQPAYLAELRHQHQSGHATYYGVMIWVVVMLEQWLSQRGL
ncbi:asparagine synthetase B [Sulfuriferula sp.]|uniref:asparagine synthetase B family protein n=1 Tax=Sulfuriferula sp. TaxID=2025307 RepID=UPI00272FABE2|nr:asparagine synthase-related protein [Sulfuriferula sp.]MDP2025303.1 asparagine synthase-related protein [Sulfuriferula sp.]